VRRTTPAALVAIAALVVTAGCTGKTTGDPTPVTTTNTTESSKSGAPAITGSELSLDKFKSDPCALLTSSQLSQLGERKPAERLDRPDEPVCKWRAVDISGVAYSLVVSAKTLDDYYENKDQFVEFLPIEVAGYPAVHFGKIDLKAGDCDTIVGLSKSTALLVQTSSTSGAPNYGTPCKNNEKAAALALETIKGAQ
jgi:hypothetical protein